MSVPRAASRHYADLRRFGLFAARRVQRTWEMVGSNFDSDWYSLIPRAAADVVLAQKAAVVTAAAYTPAVLAETGAVALPVGDVDTQGFAGVNRYGNAVPQVLAGATTVAKRAVAEGAATSVAALEARRWLTSTVLTLVSDAGRSVVSADVAQRPRLGGYVRMLNTPSCARCVILAGKWFRWNEGFQRHPRCDCQHIPAGEDRAGDMRTDPYAYFRSLSKAEQERLFGKAEAEAIREGADIYRVTNARVRGLATTTGRRGWQARQYGTPSRLTVNDILERAAGDREAAVEMLLDEGYITGPQTVGGNIKGRYYTGYAGTMGRGGTRRGATMAFQNALVTGVRDPYAPAGMSLDSATQTAAERRLHTAYLNHRAMVEGRNPFGNRPLSPSERATIEQVYRDELANLINQPPQVRRLAALLGMV